MFAEPRLKELEDAKRLVLLQAEIHRGLLRLECQTLFDRFGRLSSAGVGAAASPPLVIAGTAVAGVLAVRYWRTLLKHAPAVLAAWRWWRSWQRGR
jgi:hypothetical protein